MTSVYVYGSTDHRVLHSFPTRRSSDLKSSASTNSATFAGRRQTAPATRVSFYSNPPILSARDRKSTRSELQSHHDLVCRLLLEKKTPSLMGPPTVPGLRHDARRRSG